MKWGWSKLKWSEDEVSVMKWRWSKLRWSVNITCIILAKFHMSSHSLVVSVTDCGA